MLLIDRLNNTFQNEDDSPEFAQITVLFSLLF